jgi:ATP-dependent helicase/nuclease subunit A
MMPWSNFTHEQKRAALLVNSGMVAAAGAGSGKTAVMAVRFVACLLDRHGGAYINADQVIAITFTREAAANLRLRIDATLRAAVSGKRFPRLVEADGVDEAPLDDEQRQHLRKALDDLPTAPICTFDSFCLEMVGAHAAHLGLDPDLTPAEDLVWYQCEEDSWDILRAEFVKKHGGAYADLVEAYGEQAIKKQVIYLAHKAAALPGGVIVADEDDPVGRILALRSRQLGELSDALREAQRVANGKTRDKIANLPTAPPQRSEDLIAWLAELDSMRAAGPAKDAIKAMHDALDFPCLRGAGDRKRARKQSLGSLIGWNAEEERRCLDRAKLIAQMMARFSVVLARETARRSNAGFTRIASEALRLLSQERGKQWLRRQYVHALLDESQDFDSLQGSFIAALRSENIRIFAVGDHRQSIYGFRHAVPEQFKSWESQVAVNACAKLADNFRTHPTLVEGVRQIFSQPALAHAFDPAHIRPGRKPHEFKRPAELTMWRVDLGGVQANAGGVVGSEAQAAEVARLITRNRAHKLEFSDHAILLRDRSRMRLFAAALERAGIPYDADYPGGLYDSQECHDIESLLRLSVCENDRFALAVAAGGPWGTADQHDKCGLVDCMAGRIDVGTFMRMTALPEVLPVVRDIAAREGAAGAIRWLAAQPRMARRYGSLPLARRRVANLLLLADEESAARVPLDIAAFVERLAQRRRLDIDAKEAGGTALGNRGVRLMTIHGAKGLEWPVVIVPDCDRVYQALDLKEPILGDRTTDQRLVVTCKPESESECRGVRHHLMRDGLLTGTREEEARLFYVACTRAIEQLHLMTASAKAAVVAESSEAVRYADLLEGSGHAWTVVAAQAQARAGGAIMAAGAINVVTAAPGKPPAQPLPDLPRAGIAEQASVRSVTELLVTAGAKPAAGPAGNKDLGIALHQALARYGCGMSQAQARFALSRFRSHPRYQHYLAMLCDINLIPGYDPLRALSEQPVIQELVAHDPRRLVSGSCDLLVRGDDGNWRLYDYKSGGAARQETSAAQVQCYAHMLRPHLDGPLVEGWLVDLETGQLLPVPVDEKAASAAWAALECRWTSV